MSALVTFVSDPDRDFGHRHQGSLLELGTVSRTHTGLEVREMESCLSFVTYKLCDFGQLT